MDITSFVVHGRNQALLYGDHSTYHRQSTKRLLHSRKKLGIANKNRGKFVKRELPAAQDVAAKPEYVHLLLLTSERAWAQAMSFKVAHTADEKGIVGRTRSHIISRLNKAACAAEHLVQILSDSEAGTSANDLLEAKAYAALIRGTMYFEKQSWEPSLQNFATARIIYSALATSAKGDIFKDLLSETIDPSMRFAAYRLNTPRTEPIPAIALRAFPRSDEALVQAIDNIDPSILSGGADSKKDASPQSMKWRSRVVKIEDAQIATAWGVVQEAVGRLEENLAASKKRSVHEVAGVYDEVLTATQDAVDATKLAIDELREEGVGGGDSRMQSLQITRTAVNYEMVSWRIGRNRVLTGPHDGATEEYGSLRRKFRSKAAQGTEHARELPPSRKLAKLREKVALYDGILQNLESIKELPGVAADAELAAKIDASDHYFEALKCLSIARSHAITGNMSNALGLIHHSSKLCRQAAAGLPESQEGSEGSALNVDVSPDAVAFLEKLLDGELQRHRAIVHIDNLRKDALKDGPGSSIPLIERLHEYPATGVDLTKIVEFPPRLALVPMKPIFLDVAWNYIDYPSKGRQTAPQPKAKGESSAPAPPQAQQQKKGWFGFGR
ncbi:hypothetical protein S40293_02766 [Stachybotrys chartarum IBT 40293]|nr:hypothetical protein S40293_02766 [Stachybotrys chartarum IBT 40293]